MLFQAKRDSIHIHRISGVGEIEIRGVGEIEICGVGEIEIREEILTIFQGFPKKSFKNTSSMLDAFNVYNKYIREYLHIIYGIIQLNSFQAVTFYHPIKTYDINLNKKFELAKIHFIDQKFEIVVRNI
eukprot:TRINITY_DN23463_c0_g1_i1.p2 TRINITY_DN23463_c0_g1~~TRINITY_DN23463_c0_g1_i1.p2  ORF type:complete len:128 (+),score=0.69 TRINITY_DN23463_c0_g1_i1:430-813(+)